MRRGWLFLWLVWAAACKRDASTGGEASASATATATAAGAASVETPHASASAVGSAKKADVSRLKLKGRPIQGGLMHAQVDKGTSAVKFPGHRVVISDQGEFLIAFYRNAPKQEKLSITFSDGAVLDYPFEIEQRTYEVDRIDGMPKNMVVLDPATKKKLYEANTRIEAARKKYTEKDCYNEGFVWPTNGKITSRYGQPRVMNGIDTGIHWGVDIAAIVGTSVRAPACGTVIFVERNVPLSGHTIVIDHGRGLSSSFLHLHTFAVKVGAEVKQGDLIGTVGMSGRTNGAHLDWRMNLFETRIDPELLAPPMK